MNIPSTQFMIEVAKVGGQYIARCSYSQGPGSVGGSNEDILITADELNAWLLRQINERVK